MCFTLEIEARSEPPLEEQRSSVHRLPADEGVLARVALSSPLHAQSQKVSGLCQAEHVAASAASPPPSNGQDVDASWATVDLVQRGICQAKNVLGLDVGRLVVILDLLLASVVRQAGQAATTAAASAGSNCCRHGCQHCLLIHHTTRFYYTT